MVRRGVRIGPPPVLEKGWVKLRLDFPTGVRKRG